MLTVRRRRIGWLVQYNFFMRRFVTHSEKTNEERLAVLITHAVQGDEIIGAQALQAGSVWGAADHAVKTVQLIKNKALEKCWLNIFERMLGYSN